MIRDDSHIDFVIKISKLFNNKFHFYSKIRKKIRKNHFLVCMQIEEYFNRKVFQFST